MVVGAAIGVGRCPVPSEHVETSDQAVRASSLTPRPANQTLTVDAVLLDLDGTLVDSESVIERAWMVWADEFGLTAEDFARIPMHGRTAIEIVADLVAADSADVALRRIIELETDADGVVAFPGARELTTALPKRRWAVVTSGSHVIATNRLKAAAIDPPALVTADDVRQGKPHPEPFLTGAERLGVEPGRCLVIEDSVSGLQAARAAGMHTVAVTTTHPRGVFDADLADVVVDELTELDVRATGESITVGYPLATPTRG